jgi:hypothetical protein
MRRITLKHFWRILCLLPLIAGLVHSEGGRAQAPDHPLFLPLVTAGSYVPTGTAPLVNVPFFNEVIDSPREYSQMAISWFGQVQTGTNYTDTRIGYSADELVIITNTFDKRLWYNPAENGSTLEDWDALTITLDLNGASAAQAPTAQSYRFVVQLRHWQPGANYQAAYRGSGSAWNQQNILFTPEVAPVGVPAANDSLDDRGWTATLRIPFSSLGLSGPPANGSMWRVSLFLHDRDSQVGPPLPVVSWPQGSSPNAPASWAQIRFGLPDYTPAPSTGPVTTTVRHGLNGAVVPDAMVGGGTNCGEGLNYWTIWGEKNYAGAIDNVVQNQINLGDWPCFTKYYLTFPLNAVPAGKVIRSARLVLNNFGGSDPTQANTSTIQVLVVAGSWEEAALNWNNAPAYRENVSRLQVPVIPPLGPAADREWDVSRAVSAAYSSGQVLNIALYSADASLHSGKYFRSSEFRDQINRPTLVIEWGDPQ